MAIEKILQIKTFFPKSVQTIFFCSYFSPGTIRKLKDCFNYNRADINPTSVARPYHTSSVALSLTYTQFLIPITFIPLKLGGSPFALTFLGI